MSDHKISHEKMFSNRQAVRQLLNMSSLIPILLSAGSERNLHLIVKKNAFVFDLSDVHCLAFGYCCCGNSFLTDLVIIIKHKASMSRSDRELR